MIKFCSVPAVMYAVLLSGCIAIVGTPDFTDEQIAAKYKDEPLFDAIKRVEAVYRKAKEDNLPLYSPTQYDRARKGMRFARSMVKDKERLNDVLRSLFVAEDALQKGLTNMAIVKREMSELLRLRASLDEREAYKIYENEYRSLISSMTGLILEIEADQEQIFNDSGRKQHFQNRNQNLVKDFKDFEIRVVRGKYLAFADQIMQEVEQYDPESTAPKVYQSTMKAQQEALAFIENNVTDDTGISTAAGKFQSEAYRLLHVAREVQKIKQLDKAAYEDYVLENEARFARISTGLENEVVKDRSFDEQAAVLANVGSKLIKRLELANESEGPNLDKLTNEIQQVREEARVRENQLLEQMEKIRVENARETSGTVEYQQQVILMQQKINDLIAQKQSLERKLATLENKTTSNSADDTAADSNAPPIPETPGMPQSFGKKPDSNNAQSAPQPNTQQPKPEGKQTSTQTKSQAQPVKSSAEKSSAAPGNPTERSEQAPVAVEKKEGKEKPLGGVNSGNDKSSDNAAKKKGVPENSKTKSSVSKSSPPMSGDGTSGQAQPQQPVVESKSGQAEKPAPPAAEETVP